MLISILVPEYNATKYIDRNLKSLLNQTYKDIEIILYDDASKDNTREKMCKYSENYPNIIYSYWSDKNGGIGYAKNQALSHANGEYVFFCDCDDYIKPNTIECMVESAVKNNYPDIVVDGFTRSDDRGNILYVRKYKDENEALQQSIPLFAKLFKREFLNKNKIKSPTGVILEDVLYLSATIPNKPSVSFVSNCGYVWIKNLTSASNTQLSKFGEHTLDNSFEYLKMVKNNMDSETKTEDITYYALQFVCWHLLKTGTGIEWNEMKNEYTKAFKYLDELFPTYKSYKNISAFKPKGVRLIVRLVVFIIILVKKFHMEKLFFFLYSKLNMGRFWPNL